MNEYVESLLLVSSKSERFLLMSCFPPDGYCATLKKYQTSIHKNDRLTNWTWSYHIIPTLFWNPYCIEHNIQSLGISDNEQCMIQARKQGEKMKGSYVE